MEDVEINYCLIIDIKESLLNILLRNEFRMFEELCKSQEYLFDSQQGMVGGFSEKTLSAQARVLREKEVKAPHILCRKL